MHSPDAIDPSVQSSLHDNIREREKLLRCACNCVMFFGGRNSNFQFPTDYSTELTRLGFWRILEMLMGGKVEGKRESG